MFISLMLLFTPVIGHAKTCEAKATSNYEFSNITFRTYHVITDTPNGFRMFVGDFTGWPKRDLVRSDGPYDHKVTITLTQRELDEHSKVVIICR